MTAKKSALKRSSTTASKAVPKIKKKPSVKAARPAAARGRGR